jgi:type VI protein secretion system component VasK
MLPHLIPDRAPNPAAHRRFRLIVGVLAILVAVVLALQYTAHALLPARKNDALWGVLVGIVGMGLLLDRQWTAAERRRPRAR